MRLKIGGLGWTRVPIFLLHPSGTASACILHDVVLETFPERGGP